MSDLDESVVATTEADDIRSSHLKNLTASISALWRKRLYTDLNLIIDGKSLKCHRAILAAASPYFHTRLFNGKRESTTDKLYINTFSRSVLAQVLEFVYHGDCRITNTNCKNLLKSACLYEIYGLKDKCDEFLSETVSADNALKMYIFANETGTVRLERTARAMIVKHFVRFAEMRMFKSLSPSELIRIVQNDELCVPNEEVVCDIVLKWARVDPANRKPVLGKIFQHIRLPNAKSEYLDIIENDQLVRDNEDCVDLVKEANIFHLDPGRRHETTSSRLDYREDAHIDDVVIVIGGAMTGRSTFKCNQSVAAFNLALKKWFPLAALPFGFDSGTAACVVNNDIYISGGGESRQGLALYESSENRWHVCAPLLVGRRGHAMVAFGKKLYVLGGAIGQSPEGKLMLTPSIEEYVMEENKWYQCGQISSAVWGMSSAVCGGKIFLMGGYVNRETPVSTVQMYDPQSQTSSFVSSLPMPLGLSKTVIIDSDVYLICPTGDVLHSDDCVRFSHVTALPHYTRALFGVAHHRGDVLLFGGKYGNDVFEDILVLDLNTMAISSIPERLYRPVWGFACVKTCLPRKTMLKTSATDLWEN